jgi:ribosome-associated translation inhibitor RaiA
MKIDVRFRNLEPSVYLRDYALRRIHAQLSRFGTEISTITVRLSDMNGPKGGADKRCHISVRGPSIGTTTIDERREDAYAAVDVVVERAAHSAGRELERQRTRRRDDGPAAARRDRLIGGLSTT